MFQQQQQALINQQAAQNKASAAGGNETLSVPHPGSRTSNSTTPVPQHYSRPPSTAMGGPQVMGSSSNVVDDQRPTSTLQMPETTPSGFSANAPTPPLMYVLDENRLTYNC
jgi:hypothetical protein